MAQPEKKKREEPESSILPDFNVAGDTTTPEKKVELTPLDPPPVDPPLAESIEILSDVDIYQKRIESQWESTKSSYQKKINQILEEFIQQNMINGSMKEAAGEMKDISDEMKKSKKSSFDSGPSFKKDSDPFGSVQDPNMTKGQMEKLLMRAQAAIRNAEKAREMSFKLGNNAPSPLSLDWKSQPQKPGKKFWFIGLGGLLLAGVIYFVFSFSSVDPVTPLPYLHTSGLVVADNRVYIIDWFRKALYVHALKKGLPIIQVENVPNDFLTGFSFSNKYFWTLDGFNHQFLFHEQNTEHHVFKKVPTPANKPVGLYFDGTDLWSMDDEKKILYRHHGNDLEDIKEKYTLPKTNLTAFAIQKNRLWILNGKSRVLTVYRMEEPVKELASFDLDQFLLGATPTGLSVKGKTIWLSTDNPANLLKLTRNQLVKQKPDEF